MFSKYEFLIITPVLDIRYEHPKSLNNNLFYWFNNQLDYVLVDYFVELETTRDNINKFLSNLLIKFITKKLSYYNANK